MNAKNRTIICNNVFLECPLHDCYEKFKYRSNLIQHLAREHDDIEAERYIEKNYLIHL